MKMHVSTRPVTVTTHFDTVVWDGTPNDTPESTEVKNINEATAFLNDYIQRNVQEGYKHLVVRKEGRAFAGFDALNKSIPTAVDASTCI